MQIEPFRFAGFVSSVMTIFENSVESEILWLRTCKWTFDAIIFEHFLT